MSYCKKCEGFGHVHVFVHGHMVEDKYIALPEEEKEFFEKKECDSCEGCGEEPGYVPECGGLDYYPLVVMLRL